MLRTCLQSLVMMVLFTLLTGILYPLAVTLIAQTAFADKANGSMIVRDGKIVGSSLIGQNFSGAQYFWTRPSGTAPAYNAEASSGSNWGIYNASLAERIAQRARELKSGSPSNPAPIPLDLLTASGSGLDPHISPEGAAWQIGRVALARDVSEETVRSLVGQHTEGRQFGMLGGPRVNVLELNLALDAEEEAQKARNERQ